MDSAIRDSGLSPEEITYINAHGTSTLLGDQVETKAIKRVFSAHASHLQISSTKSMIGHLLGASGGVEFVASVLTLFTDTIHPTINYENPDPLCDLDYVPNVARSTPVKAVMSNSFGFGGHNATLVLGKV
jgi:3-oxoacyl-[acyl-carrier-protein] synthase II